MPVDGNLGDSGSRLTTELVGLVDRFRADWTAGRQQSVEQFLQNHTDEISESDSDLRRPFVCELIKTDLRFIWQPNVVARTMTDDTSLGDEAQTQFKVEDYLASFPDLSDQHDLLLELIVAEYRARQQFGDQPTHAEYFERFAKQKNRLKKLLAEVDQEITASSQSAEHAETILTSQVDPLQETVVPATRSEGAQPKTILSEFGDYELLEEIARGGMGVVYKARQKKLNRLVAVKMILAGQLASEEDVRRFYTEAEAAAQLDHVGIVPIFEVDELDGQHFFSMGFIDGESLSDRVSHGPLPPREAVEIVLQVADAVEYAHQHGVIHRDLKPHNILMSSDGQPKVTDFGLAKTTGGDSNMTASGQVLGTPSYMSPEQAAGRIEEVGALADVYSLGAVLYCLLTGRPPFHSANVIETLKQVTETPPVSPRLLNPGVDKDLETICLKCLEKEPSARFSSAADLRDELDRFLKGESIQSRRVGLTTHAWRWCKRKPFVAGSCVAMLVAALSLWAAISIGRQAEDVRLLANLKSEFQSGLDSPELTDKYLGRMENLVASVSVLDSESADSLRDRLHRVFGSTVESSIRKQRLSDEDKNRISDGLKLLETRDTETWKRLNQVYENRLVDWQPLFSLVSPYTNSQDVFQSADVLVKQNGLVNTSELKLRTKADHRESKEFDHRLMTVVPAKQVVQVVAQFSPEWEKALQIGLWLNTDGEGVSGYEFRVSVSQSRSRLRSSSQSRSLEEIFEKSLTFAEARQQTTMVAIEIRKNGSVLQKRMIPMTSLKPGKLTLRAVRDRGRLTFQVLDLPPLEFEDLFPFGEETLGYLGVECPPEVKLLELVAEHKERPSELSPLQQGDVLFDSFQFTEALEIYKKQALVLKEPEFRNEALYKQAQCLLKLKRETEAVSVYESMFQSGDDRWMPLAGSQLWLLKLRHKKFDEAGVIFDIMSAKFSSGQLASLIPSEVRDEIMNGYLGSFASISKVLSYKPERLRNMQRAAAIDKFLSPDGEGTYAAKGQLMRAYRFAGDLETALELAEELAYTYGDITMARHYCRLLRYTDQAKKAAEVASEFIERMEKSGYHRWQLLQVERAKAHVLLGQWDEAESEIDWIIQDQKRPQKESDTGDDYALGMAYLMKGFLQERRGNDAAAQATWKSGLNVLRPDSGKSLRFDVTNSFTVHLLIMESLTDQLSDDFLDRVISESSHLEGGASFTSMVLSMVNRTTLRNVFREMWKSDRGLEAARKIGFGQATMRDFARLPVVLAGYEFLKRVAFGGQISKLQDDIAWNTVDEIYTAIFLNGKINAAQVAQLGLTWKGTTNFLGWGGLAPGLDPEYRGSLAYVFAHRYLRRKNKPQAIKFFQTAQNDLPAGSPMAELAKTDLELVQSGKGMLIFDSDVPQPVSIVVSQNGKELQSKEVSGHTEIKLAAGKYQLALAGKQAGLVLNRTNFTLAPAGRHRVQIRKLWSGSEREHALPGLISNPAEFPNVGRWQIEFTHPSVNISAMDVSSAASLVACGSLDGTIRVYDIQTRKLVRLLLGHTKVVVTLAFSPDGKTLLSGGQDKLFIVWDIEHGRQKLKLPGHRNTVTSVDISPDGKMYAAAGWYGEIRLWDQDGKPLGEISGHKGAVAAIAFSPDGETLVSVGQHDKTLRLWNLQTLAIEKTFGKNDDQYLAAGLSPDGNWLSVADSQRRVTVWNMKTFEREFQFEKLSSPVNSLNWNADNGRLLIGITNKFFYVWDRTKPEAELITFKGDEGWMRARWNPIGEGFITTHFYSMLSLWDEVGTRVTNIGEKRRHLHSLEWSPSGKTLFAANYEHLGRLISLDGQPSPVLDAAPSSIRMARSSPNGKQIATIGFDRKIHLWNLAGELQTILTDQEKQGGYFIGLAAGPDERLAVATNEQTIEIWKSGDKPDLVLPFEHRNNVQLGFSPAGNIAALAPGLSLVVWNSDGTQLVELKTDSYQMRTFAWHPNGKSIALGCNDSRVRFWDLQNEPEEKFKALHGPVESMAFSPDQAQLAVGMNNYTIKVWSLDQEKELTIQSPVYRVSHIDWSPDGRELVFGGAESSFWVCDAATGEITKVITLLPEGKTAVFDASGRLLSANGPIAGNLTYVLENAAEEQEILTPAEFYKRVGIKPPAALTTAEKNSAE